MTPRADAGIGMATEQDAPSLEVARLMRRLRRTGLAALGLWAALAMAWAMLAPISGSVVGTGLVKVAANRQTVSHRDGGTVARILVHEGETVKQGQALIVLEDVRVDASVDLMSAQLRTEHIRRSRLQAEVALQASWTPPRLEGSKPDERARASLAQERAAFEARRHTLRGQIEAVQAQMGDTEVEMRAHLANRAAALEAMRLLREEIAANELLMAENFIDRTRVTTLKRGLADYESRIQAAEAEASKARQRHTELGGRLAQMRDGFAQAAAEELREVNGRIVDLEERLRSGQDTADRQAVVSPSDGRLVDLRVNTVGSAIGAREPIVDIVPAQARLVVEARIGADAAGEIRPGQTADIQLLAGNRRSTDLLQGRVVLVSADALLDARTGAPYFAVQVEVPAAAASAAQVPVLPGMAAEVFIRTAERTPLSFLLTPLTSGMRKAFREH